MLPPISAALSASVDYQTAGRPIQRSPVSAASGQPTAAMPMPANLLNGGRIDVLSLFSQLNIAQGLSVFAETVGSYLKISRREGESLIDYAHRLAEAVKSLSASQRMMLEQTLAQLVRGMTLRTLNEVLSNPLGPEAARVSVYLEAEQLMERDPVARAVVSSYRSDGGADIASASAAIRASVVATAMPTRQASPVPVSYVGELASTGSAGAPAMGAGSGAPATSSLPSSSAFTGAEATAGRMEGRIGDGLRVKAETAIGIRSTSFVKQTEDAGANRTSLDPATNTATSNSGAGSAGASDPLPLQKGPVPGRVTASEPTSAPAPGAGSPVIYDGPALARLAQRAVGDTKNKFLQEVLYHTAGAPNPLPAEAATPDRENSTQVLADLAAPKPGQDAASQLLRPEIPEASNRPAKAVMAGTLEVDETPLPAPGGAAKAAASPLLAYATPDPTAFVLAAPMMAREGFAQAFVAYPQVPPPPPEEERDVERVAAIDEDGGGRSSQQDAQDEREGEEGESAADESQGETVQELNAGAPDHAEDLYWRMADLS
ncbi:MAG TPA: hypothetical protein VGO22_07915 [Pseudorhizobium sp.]|nr:hypothetical protein [Pseudorhizobium sp.]